MAAKPWPDPRKNSTDQAHSFAKKTEPIAQKGQAAAGFRVIKETTTRVRNASGMVTIPG